MELTSLLAGVSGEYFVAAELSRRGYLASITLRNTKGVDILCSNAEATKSVAIQVKTNRLSNRDWILNVKAEASASENFFYIFVNLNDGKEPDYFVVPSVVVAEHVKLSHRQWLDSPGKNGSHHVDGPIRKFTDRSETYLGRWDLLNL